MKQLLWSVLFVSLLAVPAMARETPMNVQIRSAPLRSGSSFLSPLVTTLDYGARVMTVDAKNGWYYVRTADGKLGWLHQSALTTKKVVMQSGASDVSATASGQELALAGKGFNSTVEADFKKKNADIDFTWIDRMEKIKVSAADMVDFLREGQVQPSR
ncbi:MAG: SH3 domain-containing protein [Verrucomicrobia bacterium]|nr:SH3 domain-containing protein [Kiritimatiellia bacterium]MCO6400662.1 SH3 domain-containing protein [Verrucomicrobiota bacterium]